MSENKMLQSIVEEGQPQRTYPVFMVSTSSLEALLDPKSQLEPQVQSWKRERQENPSVLRFILAACRRLSAISHEKILGEKRATRKGGQLVWAQDISTL